MIYFQFGLDWSQVTMMCLKDSNARKNNRIWYIFAACTYSSSKYVLVFVNKIKILNLIWFISICNCFNFNFVIQIAFFFYLFQIGFVVYSGKHCLCLSDLPSDA